MRKTGVVVALVCVVIAAVGIGQYASALTQCNDDIFPGWCSFYGVYNKTCCLEYDFNDWHQATIPTEKWMNGGSASNTYWTNPEPPETWGAACSPGGIRECM